MSENRRTPEQLSITQRYSTYQDEIGIPGKAVATVWTRKKTGVYHEEQKIVDDPEGQAFARLFIAAPDLLARLKATTARLIAERDVLYDNITDNQGRITHPPDGEDLAALDVIISANQEAIAKAEGHE